MADVGTCVLLYVRFPIVGIVSFANSSDDLAIPDRLHSIPAETTTVNCTPHDYYTDKRKACGHLWFTCIYRNYAAKNNACTFNLAPFILTAWAINKSSCRKDDDAGKFCSKRYE